MSRVDDRLRRLEVIAITPACRVLHYRAGETLEVAHQRYVSDGVALARAYLAAPEPSASEGEWMERVESAFFDQESEWSAPGYNV